MHWLILLFLATPALAQEVTYKENETRVEVVCEDDYIKDIEVVKNLETKDGTYQALMRTNIVQT